MTFHDWHGNDADGNGIGANHAECAEQATAAGSTFFGLEFAESPLYAGTGRASCGYFGDFSRDGLLDDSACAATDSDGNRFGRANTMAIYAKSCGVAAQGSIGCGETMTDDTATGTSSFAFFFFSKLELRILPFSPAGYFRFASPTLRAP